MELLPDEVIEHILADSNLSAADVVNFSSTCSKFREIVNSNRSLWRVKYFQRWPKTEIEIVCQDWHKEFISRRCFEKDILQLLSLMSSQLFHLDIKNIGGLQLNFIVHLINSYEYGYYYLKDFLVEITRSKPVTQALTNKYYGNILMKYIHKWHSRLLWNNLLKVDMKEQTLEKGAMFVTLWHQEYERGIWNGITSELDNIANLVLRHLLQHYKDHPLKDIPEETRLAWRNENIQGNMFEPEHCKSIIWAIHFVLFGVLRFCVAYNSNDLDRKRFGIDCALVDRKANPTIFAVIYESTARRLGVRLEILEFPDHCLLRWTENYSVEGSLTHYVNTSGESLFITSRCPRKSNSNFVITPCNMQQIAQSAALQMYPRVQEENHLAVRDALELLLVVKPFSLECYQVLSRSYMLHEMDARDLILKLKDIRSQVSSGEWRWFQPLLHSLELYQQTWERNHSMDCSQTSTVQNRAEDIDFAVGMIVRLSDRKGVIYGWTLVPPAATRNPRGPRQVFYNVLVDDGSYQYVPQKKLKILHSPPLVSHPCIGRFFDEYCTTFYRPNRELQAKYPQDVDALQKILKKDRQA